MNMLDEPILITGSSSGIGFALARELADAGAKTLILSARNPQKLDSACSEISGFGTTQVTGLILDQQERASVEQACANLEKQQLTPLTIICNVGMNPVHQTGPRKVQSTDPAQIIDSFNTNVVNALVLVQRYLPLMRKAKFGRLLFVGSQAYRYGMPGQVSYNLSKSALVGLVNTLNSEYAKSRIMARLCNLGIISNERTRQLRRTLHNAMVILSEEEAARKLCQQLLDNNWLAQPEVDIP